ncbi:hypothetical protein K2173_009435 [Erythroxylum novogranatense]|uniref:1-phosphatidylinositol-3-phosphate 5-kinase n=1 Tax=Erythroxylum novogranatense TaxID=1862640 RepID=A0AAV8U737_9ROSI|nr:hypothetical protein K2173_009435 [Erythroxylum novogranatense]
MDSPDKTLSELVGIFKSWVPWRPEPPSVSKDFWMPDQSCRVCYDCDSQFTVFNRRHHCRLCGRIFCAKCTANSFPVPSGDPSKAQDEWEKIRVCNYCFKQWQKGVTYFDHVTELPSLDLSGSPSGASLTSSISSGTANSTSSLTLGSRAYSVGSYQQTYCSSGPNPAQKSEMENTPVKPGEIAVKRSNIPVADGGYQSSHQYSFSMNRSDDEDEDDYGIYHSDSETKHFPHVNDYYSQLEFDDLCTDDGSQKVHLDGETIESKGTSSALLNHNCGLQGSERTSPSRIKDDNDVNVECEPPSSMYPGEDDNMEPVDFESNGLLWLPPEPEDEQDEREAGLFEDDDCYEGDSAGEWGCLRASSSFGSGDFRNKDKSTEEQKQVMKNVVDGHFRALVAQLLLVENVPLGDENDKDSWLEIVTSLSWEAATLLKPDMSTGGGMDPGGYVKVKCIASGHRSESVVIKGVVCKKNVAHRRMISKIEKPRLLILGGALEYQRVTNHLSSFDTLLQQEMDHLKMAVARIDAHHPNVLLVERSVSRFAQEYLLAKDISLVLNIKRPLLERIARCTGAQIVPSVDHLSSPKLGHCDTFHVQKFSEYLGTAGQGGKKTVKTLMYFEGCPKPLGFTILLRGANVDELKRVKHVVQYGVFAAYHLALETSFLADEGASLPELPLISPITVALPDKSSTIERSISTVPGFTLSTNEKPQGLEISGEPQRSNSIPITCLASAIHNSFNQVEGELPTDGPSSESPECTSSFINLTTILDTVPSAINFGTDFYHSYTAKKEGSESSFVPEMPAVSSGVATTTDQFALKGCELLKKVEANPSQNDLWEIAATRQHSSEVSSQLDSNIRNNFEDSGPLKEEFPPSPSDHQSILVSLSSRCVWKGSVCERSHLFRIKYYGNCDKPLGRFLRDHLFDQNYACPSCDMPSEAHVHCYTHRQGTLTISVKKLSEILLPGEKDGKIWMWHRCLKCPRTNGFPPATRRVVMSDAAWGLSFGKFLELSFSNHAAASRVASCGHSLHRDCLRFYGFGNMVACFRYASISVLSVYLPPAKLDFNFENQDWIKKETDEVVNRAELLFSEVLNALSQIVDKRSSVASANSGMKTETRRQIAGLELMLQKEKAEFEESLQKILNREAKKSQPAIDILEINRLRRQLLFQSYMWDHRLIYAAGIHNSSIQDGLNISTAEYEGKRLSNTEKLDEVDALEKDFTHYDSRPLDPEAFIKTEQQGEFNSNTDGSDAFDEETEIDGNLDHLRQDQAKLSAAISLSDNSVTLESSNNISGTSFEDQAAIMANLSASLDAAWTGDNHHGIGVPKNDGSAHFDSTAADSSTKVVEPEHADLEGYMEDQKGLKFGYSLPTALSTKGHDNTEDYTSWLKMPFLNFYRSFNKNFITNSAKLDTLGDYNPVFVSSFRELEFEGSARLLLPVGTNDTVIPVYDDEPTSIIAYALMSPEYHGHLNDDLEKMKESGDFSASMNLLDSVSSHSFHSVDELTIDSYKSFGPSDDSFLSVTGSRSSLILDPLSYTKAMHVKVSFGDVGPTSKVKYSVTCYYAQRFDALRRVCCPSELDFIRSLSRCKKWGAQGGKSNVFFAKTLDDRFIIKQVTKTELESFIKFGPGYFKYLSESISSRCPTCLAKILGIYQVTSKHLKGGRETKIDVLVMENLLFGRNVTRLYDLKGSSRSRYNPDSSGSNKVLLDQNLIEAMPTSPIFVGNKAKRLLERAVWNDTSFLASIDVMDYSLLVGVDEENHELVLGIIDFMRQYTWDKHLETWVKASRILGGNTNLAPTVISPKQYKKRFRKAMTTYFLMVPDQWSPPCTVTSKSQAEVGEENIPGGTSVQ